MSTWEEMMDNVKDGNVGTDTNDVYSFATAVQAAADEYFTERPGYTLEIPLTTGAEASLGFKNGWVMGIACEHGLDMANPTGDKDIQIWLSSPDATKNIHTSAGGTPCCFCVSTRGRLYNIRKQPTDIGDDFIYPTDRVAIAYSEVVGKDGKPHFDYPIMIGWGTHEIGVGMQALPDWEQPYGEDRWLEQEWYFGNPFLDIPEFRDAMATDEFKAEDYPGEPGGTGGGAGEGTYDFANDEQDFTPLPGLSAVELGVIHIYNPTPQQMIAITRWLWTEDFEQNIIKNYTSPFENIIAVAITPIRLTAIIDHFTIGNTATELDVGYIGNQYKVVDCGTINTYEAFGSYLDYDGTYQIFLPFIGFRPLRADDILGPKKSGTNISVQYHVDLGSGAAVCEIRRINKDGEKNILYTYNTNVFYMIPMSGANFQNMYNQQNQIISQGIFGAIGNALSLGGGNAGGGLGLLSGISSMQSNLQTLKPDYGRTGTLGGNVGYFGCRTPYIVKSLPWSYPISEYDHNHGYVMRRTFTLSQLSGYTEVEAVEVDGIECTDDEKQEIKQLLMSGVYL